MPTTAAQFCAKSGEAHVSVDFCTECGAPPWPTNVTTTSAQKVGTVSTSVASTTESVFPPVRPPFHHHVQGGAGNYQPAIGRASDPDITQFPNGPRKGLANSFRNSRKQAYHPSTPPSTVASSFSTNSAPGGKFLINIKVAHTEYLNPEDPNSHIRYTSFQPVFQLSLSAGTGWTYDTLINRLLERVRMKETLRINAFCDPPYIGVWDLGHGHMTTKTPFALLEPWLERADLRSIMEDLGYDQKKSTCSMTLVWSRTRFSGPSLKKILDRDQARPEAAYTSPFKPDDAVTELSESRPPTDDGNVSYSAEWIIQQAQAAAEAAEGAEATARELEGVEEAVEQSDIKGDETVAPTVPTMLKNKGKAAHKRTISKISPEASLPIRETRSRKGINTRYDDEVFTG
jgi:hypothetical protein